MARWLKLWVVLGSNHPLTGRHKPHNSLYLINDCGEIIDRYDKMSCTKGTDGAKGDLDFYSPGSRLVVFTVQGFCCGLQICHDFRYQELYREYKNAGRN